MPNNKSSSSMLFELIQTENVSKSEALEFKIKKLELQLTIYYKSLRHCSSAQATQTKERVLLIESTILSLYLGLISQEKPSLAIR